MPTDKKGRKIAEVIISKVREEMKKIDFSKTIVGDGISIDCINIHDEYQLTGFTACILEPEKNGVPEKCLYFYLIFGDDHHGSEMDKYISFSENPKEISRAFRKKIAQRLRERMHEEWQELWNIYADAK